VAGTIGIVGRTQVADRDREPEVARDRGYDSAGIAAISENHHLVAAGAQGRL
jgi:glucosamine 6-phosphate synthetase-like amidotransferase/phosphosugar isomerase protein